MPSRLHLDRLNAMPQADFVAAIGFLVENSPWVLGPVAGARPFDSANALCEEIGRTLRALPMDDLTAVMNAHPELAGAEAAEGTMNEDSTSEQARLGLLALDKPTFVRLNDLNRAYREKFGFPCIVALWNQPDLQSVLNLFEARLHNDAGSERDRNLAQIGLVVRDRARRIETALPNDIHDAS